MAETCLVCMELTVMFSMPRFCTPLLLQEGGAALRRRESSAQSMERVMFVGGAAQFGESGLQILLGLAP